MPRGLGLFAGLGLFIVFLLLHVFATQWFSHAFPRSWSWTELLVNYQGGFVKRGLLGELAFRAQDMIAPQQLLVSLIFFAYALTTLGLIFYLHLHEELPGLLFLLSPTGWLFSILTPAAYGRKDVFVVAAFAASLIIVAFCRRKIVALGLTMLIFALAGLIVEISWFYYPLILAAFLFRWRDEPVRWQLATVVTAGFYTLACLMLTLFAKRVDTAAIAASWHGFPFVHDDTGALCCLNFDLPTALSYTTKSFPYAGSYAIVFGFGLVPLILLIVKRQIFDRRHVVSYVAIPAVLSAAFPIVVAADWGRYIYLLLTTTFLAYWAGARSMVRDGEGSPRQGAYELCGKAALVFLYASTWQTVHFQFNDLSAFIPGAMFRLVDGSGTTPRPN